MKDFIVALAAYSTAVADLRKQVAEAEEYGYDFDAIIAGAQAAKVAEKACEEQAKGAELVEPNEPIEEEK